MTPKNYKIHLEDVWLYNNQQKPSSFDFRKLIVITFILPIAIFLIYNSFAKNRYDLENAILGLTLSMNLTSMITNFLKVLVGRPRPDFLARCFPSYKIDLDSECTGQLEDVKEGRKSFPSGHSSMSFASLGFLAFYFAGKLHLFVERRNSSWKLIIFLLPFMAATTVALSRISDNRHHWQDVLVGSLIGLCISYLSYKLYYPTLICENCHKPMMSASLQRLRKVYKK